MAITLGRDASVSIGGAFYSARSCSIQYTAKTVEIEEWGSSSVQSYTVGVDAIATVEINDPSEASGAIGNIWSGATMSVSGGASGMSFTGIITSVTESASVDGVSTVVIEARQGRPS